MAYGWGKSAFLASVFWMYGPSPILAIETGPPPQSAIDNHIARTYFLADKCEALTISPVYVKKYFEKTGQNPDSIQFKQRSDEIWHEMNHDFSRNKRLAEQEACFMAAIWLTSEIGIGMPAPFIAVDGAAFLKRILD